MHDFNNKTFSLLKNSELGEVSDDTIFKYQQSDDLVTADYFGGTVRYGKIIARLDGDFLHMLYQCLTTEGELKAGMATAKITKTKDDKLQLHLDWHWMQAGTEKGISKYVEQ